MSKEILTIDQISQMIQEINNGNKDAAIQLISNYADDIRFQAKMYNSGKEEISESFQKACNKAIKSISELNYDNPEKWFGTIAAETAVSVPVEMETTDVLYDSSDEHIDKNIQLPENKATIRKSVLSALTGLSTAERVAFALRFYEHLDNAEVAQKLHIDTVQVETLLTNAKSKLIQKELSIPAIITAMNYLNPSEEKEEEAAPVIIPVAEPVVNSSKKLPGSKTLLLALAGVLIAAILFIVVSGKLNNSSVNKTDNDPKTQETQKETGKSGSKNESGSAETTSNENGKNENQAHHGLVVEDEIIEDISSSGNGDSNTSNSGNSGENAQSGENSPTITPAPETGSSTTDNPPSEDGTEYDPPTEEVDLGGGDVLGGF